eukprot:TRINITY_DN4252_c0_g1_i1.p1 TRINITY_DN4252_c0_g1~~TRINITY_DN4252_c0_g1_i1.p1  ORF type:complete len:110 (+),score=3.32 TRINITY_DN4252_c0_g1_i1:20-349(+)
MLLTRNLYHFSLSFNKIKSHLLVSVISQLVIVAKQLSPQSVDLLPLAGGVVVVHHLDPCNRTITTLQDTKIAAVRSESPAHCRRLSKFMTHKKLGQHSSRLHSRAIVSS